MEDDTESEQKGDGEEQDNNSDDDEEVEVEEIISDTFQKMRHEDQVNKNKFKECAVEEVDLAMERVSS